MIRSLLAILLMMCCSFPLCLKVQGAPLPSPAESAIWHLPIRSPESIEQSFAILDRTLPPEYIEYIAKTPESRLGMYDLGLGVALRNQWSLRKSDSPLGSFFLSYDVLNADDRSGMLILSYWRHLHHFPLHLDEQVRQIHDRIRVMESRQRIESRKEDITKTFALAAVLMVVALGFFALKLST